MKIRHAGCVIVLGLWALCGFAQQSSPAGQGNREITLAAVAVEKSGAPVAGLAEQDFTVLDNKQPQKIVSFRAATRSSARPDPPVEVILLLDEVNGSFRAVAQARQQIQKFLGEGGGELTRPVSLAFLSDAGLMMGDAASQDGKALIAQLNQRKGTLRVINRSQGFYGAGDRVQLSLRALGEVAGEEAKKPGRKLLVWISPGWPLLTGPNIQLSSKDQQGIFNSVVAVSDALQQAHITLYSVDPLGTADAAGFRTFYYKQFVKGVTAPRQVQIGNLALQVFAVQSGGLVLNSSNDVAGEIAKCVTDSNAFYVLSFEKPAADGPNEFHALEVKVDKPGVSVRTRSGYYSQPDQTQAR